MTTIVTFEEFAGQLRAFMTLAQGPSGDTEFNRLAAALFTLQTAAVPIYGDFCRKRNVSAIADWREIPALPTTAFKDYDVTSLPPSERTSVFHSSGTTQQRPGRHFHNAPSLALYEQSVRLWFRPHFLNSPSLLQLVALTPANAPHSSLAHMFATVQSDFSSALFTGQVDESGAWTLDLERTVAALEKATQPVAIVGTAFSFVHLLDHCRGAQRRFRLPAGSRALETGGYKGRTRAVPKQELRQLMTRWLGIPASHIVGEYGMSELSSQAYDKVIPEEGAGVFQFPPWARAQIVSPETGREVAVGETGMIRIIDLANVRSVLAVQTEDLAIRRENGFELVGRAAQAELRGCSLLQQELSPALA